MPNIKNISTAVGLSAFVLQGFIWVGNGGLTIGSAIEQNNTELRLLRERIEANQKLVEFRLARLEGNFKGKNSHNSQD